MVKCVSGVADVGHKLVMAVSALGCILGFRGILPDRVKVEVGKPHFFCGALLCTGNSKHCFLFCNQGQM